MSILKTGSDSGALLERFPITVGQAAVTMLSGVGLLELPAPLFGDSRAYDIKNDLQYTMTGIPYTFVKQSAKKIYTSVFELTRPQALQLIAFVIAAYKNSVPISFGGISGYLAQDISEFETIEIKEITRITLVLEG